MSDKPNIVLIISDHLRADALGCDRGDPTVHTPNLDYLASAGTRFCHAYTAVPSCIPARAVIMTGMDQWHTGILGMGRGQGHMPNDYPYLLADQLRQGGYQTHLTGKGHFHPMRAPMGFESTELDEGGNPGTDYRNWFEAVTPDGLGPDDHGVGWNSWHARPWHTHEYLHRTTWTATRAIEFLKGRDQHRPFFLNISFHSPHSPYVPPQAFWDMFDESEIPPPPVGDWASVHDDAIEKLKEDAWRGRMTPRQTARARRGYRGEVSFLDSQVGRILLWLRRYQRPAFSNTWFIITADHGDMQGDHNLWRKTYAYEGSCRVPLIIVPPAGHKVDRPVADEVAELRDIMPTILEIAGLENPPTIMGRSLLPATSAPVDDWRQYIHGEHCHCYHKAQEMQFVTDGREKFIWLPRLGVEQFFDLREDPDECRDLVDSPDHQDRVELWRGRLISELAARECGWCADGTLSCPPEPLVSPWKQARWQGEP
jgi:arylsulfatase A-like enzyme